MSARGKPASRRTVNTRRSARNSQEDPNDQHLDEVSNAGSHTDHNELEELPEFIKEQFHDFIKKTVADALQSATQPAPSTSGNKRQNINTDPVQVPRKAPKGNGVGKSSKSKDSLNDLTVGPPPLYQASDDESDPDSDVDMETEQIDYPIRNSFGMLVGESLSKKLHKKIVNDQFVEMFDLLPTTIDKDKHLVIKED